jgi:hypothetical protein
MSLDDATADQIATAVRKGVLEAFDELHGDEDTAVRDELVGLDEELSDIEAQISELQDTLADDSDSDSDADIRGYQ